MNLQKLFLIPSMALLISSSVAIDFNASEVHTTSEIIFEQTTDVVYAPVHPTSEEVEAAATDIVTFNDANLEQALAHDLGVAVGDITVGDMETLTDLNLSYNSISDITGLEYATNLTYLDLSYNSISDITPLSGLTNLTYLYLYENSISDITPLSGLTNLTDLNLSYNSISDITPLSGLTNLTYLDLDSNSISDITPLSGLTNLTYLYLYENSISDITPLSGLTNLTDLNLSYNSISDITPLSGLTNLTYLNLSYNSISDITPLSGLTNLTYLNLSYNSISDITPLSGLTNLTYLNLYENSISDITPLSGLTNLTYLDLDSNSISDITPLSGLTNLTYLYLYENSISDITPLSGLTNLTYLNLSYNSISDITPLSGLTNLTYLDLDSNSISDITPLSGLTNLTYLDLDTQTINLEDITVNNNDELFHPIIDIDGIAHQVSLGIPQDGIFYMTGDWNISTSIGSVTDEEFQGHIYQKVTYEELSLLTGTDNASTYEEVSLTDEDLITLFEVTNSEELTITVNQSAIDYSTPGDYTVIFTDTDDNEFTGSLTITDVLPTLTINNDTVTLATGSSLNNILEQLTYSATEITEGDLTSSISIDDSAVDYSTAGSYDVIFSVQDEEGNEVSKTVTVIIEDDSTEVVNPETPDVSDPDEVTSEDSTDEVSTEDSTDEVSTEDSTDDFKEMSLATTGGKIIGTLAVLLAIVIVALGLKRFIKE